MVSLTKLPRYEQFCEWLLKKKKLEKIDWIINNHFHNNKKAKNILFKYLNDDDQFKVSTMNL